MTHSAEITLSYIDFIKTQMRDTLIIALAAKVCPLSISPALRSMALACIDEAIDDMAYDEYISAKEELEESDAQEAKDFINDNRTHPGSI